MWTIPRCLHHSPLPPGITILPMIHQTFADYFSGDIGNDVTRGAKQQNFMVMEEMMGIGAMGQIFFHEPGPATLSNLELPGDRPWGRRDQLLPLAAELVRHRTAEHLYSELG